MKVIDEIKQMAPTLLRYSDKLSSDTPENYFMNLQDEVWNKLGIIDGRVPKDYFSELQPKLMTKISLNYKISWTRYIPAVAASIAIIIVASLVLNTQNSIIETQITEPELALYYLENNIDAWQVETIADYNIIEESDLSELYTYDENLDEIYLESLDPEDIDLELLEIIE